MDQGAVISRFVDFTAALRVYNVEILSVEDLWAPSTDLWKLLTTVWFRTSEWS